MKSKDILYSVGNNDECYTPCYGVTPILKYIQAKAITLHQIGKFIVWCPFDKENSEFVKQISKLENVSVEYSHIDNGQNFFEYEPKRWDIMVSNPPFTNKRKYFERALSFGKPFALIMSNTLLNDSAPKQLFKDKELQLLMFDRRMQFIRQNGHYAKQITFSSSYYCWNFLPKQIIMESLK